MALGIYRMNARSWETLVLSILKSGLLRTASMIPATKNKLNRQQENNDIVNHAADEITLQENGKLSAEAEAQ